MGSWKQPCGNLTPSHMSLVNTLTRLPRPEEHLKSNSVSLPLPSLVPRLSAWAERRAWSTLSAHAQKIPRFSGICKLLRACPVYYRNNAESADSCEASCSRVPGASLRAAGVLRQSSVGTNEVIIGRTLRSLVTAEC